jgi:predicted DNA-binding protein YlxM (UPF0122 family)
MNREEKLNLERERKERHRLYRQLKESENDWEKIRDTMLSLGHSLSSITELELFYGE